MSYQNDTTIPIATPVDDWNIKHDETKYRKKFFLIGFISGIILLLLIVNTISQDHSTRVTTELSSRHHASVIDEIESVNAHYEKLLQKLVDRNVTTLTADDWKQLVEWYALDVRVQMGDNVLHGREQLIHMYLNMAGDLRDMTSYAEEVDELHATSDTTAYQIGRSYALNKKGKPLFIESYIALWKKIDDKWYIVAESGDDITPTKKSAHE